MAERAHETSDVPIKAVLFWTGLATLAIALALAALYLIFQRGDAGPASQALWAARPQEGPRLQRDPVTVLDALRERDRRLLEEGPLSIGEAMVLTADSGWREGNPDPSRAAQVAQENPHLPALADPREPDLEEDSGAAAQAPGEDEP